MALSFPFVVRVEVKPGASFGYTMNQIRSWLDRRKIQPALFQPVTEPDRGVGFEIGFKSEEEAHRFEGDFATSKRQRR